MGDKKQLGDDAEDFWDFGVGRGSAQIPPDVAARLRKSMGVADPTPVGEAMEQARAEDARGSPATGPSDSQALPCPLCGGPAAALLQAEDAWRVWCLRPTAACGLIAHPKATEAEAIAAWNRRPDPIRAELVEALREVDRWALVIESAIRNDAPSDHASIVTVMRRVTAAITKAEGPAATLGEAVRAARGGDAPTPRKGYA